MPHQRPPQRDALALAAGQRGRLAIEQRLQLQHRCRLAHARGDLGLAGAAQFQAETQVLGHAHVRIQRVALEHHRDVAILRRDLVHHAVADTQLAAADRLQARDHPQQGGLAAARRPDQHQQFAVVDLEAGVVDANEAVGIDLAQTIQRELRHEFP